jgi:thioredoxin reductase
VKKLVGVTIIGAGIVGVVAAIRRMMSGERRTEQAQFERDIERFEDEGGAPAP